MSRVCTSVGLAVTSHGTYSQRHRIGLRGRTMPLVLRCGRLALDRTGNRRPRWFCCRRLQMLRRQVQRMLGRQLLKCLKLQSFPLPIPNPRLSARPKPKRATCPMLRCRRPNRPSPIPSPVQAPNDAETLVCEGGWRYPLPRNQAQPRDRPRLVRLQELRRDIVVTGRAFSSCAASPRSAAGMDSELAAGACQGLIATSASMDLSSGQSLRRGSCLSQLGSPGPAVNARRARESADVSETLRANRGRARRACGGTASLRQPAGYREQGVALVVPGPRRSGSGRVSGRQLHARAICSVSATTQAGGAIAESGRRGHRRPISRAGSRRCHRCARWHLSRRWAPLCPGIASRRRRAARCDPGIGPAAGTAFARGFVASWRSPIATPTAVVRPTSTWTSAASCTSTAPLATRLKAPGRDAVHRRFRF